VHDAQYLHCAAAQTVRDDVGRCCHHDFAGTRNSARPSAFGKINQALQHSFDSISHAAGRLGLSTAMLALMSSMFWSALRVQTILTT